eukprot:XP_003243407.1 PREDICTED: uncharacterized protein LOC100573739 [Acyrthosiphon pisum]
MAKIQLCPLVPCNFAMFCGMIYIIVIMGGTFYFSTIMSSQQQSYTHLQRNNVLVYFVENRRVSTDITDGAEEKHRHVAVVQPQKQIRTIAHSSWLVPLCHVQWLLPLLTFCEKHRQKNHTLLTEPTKSTNETRSDNNTSTGFVRKDMVTNDNEYLARTKGKYNTIDLPFSRLVPLVYIAFIFGVGLIVIFIFSLCVCFRSKRTLEHNEI